MGGDKGETCAELSKAWEKCVNLLQQGSAVPYNWFLPVISGFEKSSLLMTDKLQSDVSLAYGMYLENHILKYI